MSNYAQKELKHVKKVRPFWTEDNARHQLDYRLPMLVTELMVFSSAFGQTSYYVCPRCDITMEREFQSYCDRCGQKLDWRRYRYAKIVWPEWKTAPVQEDEAEDQHNQKPVSKNK